MSKKKKNMSFGTYVSVNLEFGFSQVLTFPAVRILFLRNFMILAFRLRLSFTFGVFMFGAGFKVWIRYLAKNKKVCIGF